MKIVDDARSELAIPLLVKDRCIGVFDLESPELDAFSQGRRGDPDAAGEPGGRGHRERAALRDDPRERSAARERAALRAAGAGGAAADRAAEADEGRRRRGPVRAGPRAGRRPLRLPVARARTAWSWRSATCRARACRRRSTAPSPASWCGRARSAGATRPERFTSGRRAGVDEHDPPRAPARGVLLHALLRHLRLQAPHGDHGQFGPAVPDPVRGRDVRADRAAGRAARRRSPDRLTTR